MVTRKESQQKQEEQLCNGESDAALPSGPPSISSKSTLLLSGKIMERKSTLCDYGFCAISSELKQRASGQRFCLKAVCAEMVSGYVAFKAETEKRAKTF